MIKIENVVLASPKQMVFIIQGMRNPKNSWDKSDSRTCKQDGSFCMECEHKYGYCLGSNDKNLMQRLSRAGTDHRKYMRMMPVYARITAGHTWWAEFDTYKVGTVRNSCSKMHKIHVMGFEQDNFDHEGIDEVGGQALETFNKVRETLEWLAKQFNETKEKKYWRAIIELLPMGFHLTANVEMNYEVLANMYRSRKGHKMFEWRDFCKWIETLPLSELITGLSKENNSNATNN
ncbi:MAG: hypothetical protein ACLR3W_13940 [Faecalibacillus intestinalis]|uniref:hypothetical protein n=1 Tax=Faecalibacillus intestinalis TaxID=1982626 RepID=UPI003994D08E